MGSYSSPGPDRMVTRPPGAFTSAPQAGLRPGSTTGSGVAAGGMGVDVGLRVGVLVGGTGVSVGTGVRVAAGGLGV